MAKSKPIKIPIKVLDQATKDVRRIKESFRGVSRPVSHLNNKFKALKRELRGIQAMGRKVGGSMKKVGRGMTYGVTAPAGVLGATILKTAADFQKGMNKVEAKLGDKATTEGMVRLNDLAKKLGSETQFSAKEAADGMSFLAQAGWDTNQILQATPGLLDLAAAAEMDLARAADITSNVMGAFKIQASEAGRVADVFAAATSSANIDMEMLGETMSQVAPIAHKSGKSLEETTAVIGMLGNIGIQGSSAGTAMKNALLNLASPSAKASKYLKRLGIQVADSKGNMLSMTDVMTNVGKGMNKLTQQQRLKVLNEIFGKRAIAGASELVDQALIIGKDGKNAIERFTESLENSNGAAGKMRDTMMKGASGAMVRLTSAAQGLAIAIGESGLLEWFTKAVMKLTDFFSKMTQTDKAMLKWGTILVGVAATLGPIIYSLGLLVTGIANLAPALVLVSPALKVFTGLSWAAMLPWIKFIAIAAAVMGVIWLLKKGWDMFGDSIVKWAEIALEKFSKVFGYLKNALGNSPLGLLMKGISAVTGLGADRPESTRQLESRSANVIRETITMKQQQQNVNASIDFSNVAPGTKIQTEGFNNQSVSFNRGSMMQEAF